MTTADASQTDKTRRLFQYLREFTQLKYKPQRTNQGDSLLWLHSLPEDKQVTNAVRNTDGSVGEEWLVIHKPRFTAPPALPDDLVAWVEGRLDDPERGPTVRAQLVVESEVLDDDLQPKKIQETLFLDQQPSVEAAWKTYLGRWQTWAKEESEAREVQRPYSQLFDFHQKLSTEGERYELRLGLGYLSWNAPSSGEVRRHLLTARAALHFDPLRGILSLTAGGDGARTTLEQDMLNSDDRVISAVQGAIQQELFENGEDLWSGETLPPLLRSWVNAASDQGVYDDSVKPPQGSSAHPVVHWAPAVILRRRSERTLAETYDSIIGQLAGGGVIPDAMRRYLGDRPAVPPVLPGTVDQTVYFPLAANDAQQAIVHRMRREAGVLVQGPPGTGKSHTIVNLVSHLLATDQKVLVTSHTARALSVLREKFPEELRSLCITHLRGEEGAQAALQGSVGELLQRFTNRQPEREESQEKLLSSQLEQARREEKKVLDTLQQIREAETGKLELFGYQGSAQQIGNLLRRQEGEFEWLSDLAIPEQDAPVDDTEALELLRLLREVGAEEAESLKHTRPAAEALTQPGDFLRFVQSEQRTQEDATRHEQSRRSPTYPAVAGATSEVQSRLLGAVQRLIAAVETERRRPQPWLAEGISAVLKEQAGRWDEVSRRSHELLPNLREKAEWLETTSVAGLEGRDHAGVRTDAEAVLAHLQSGGNWGNFLLKPAAVKNRLYLKEIKVGGRSADVPETLQLLLDHLRLHAQLGQLTGLWEAQGVVVTGPLALQVTELSGQLEALDRVLALKSPLQEAQQAVQAVAGLAQPQWWAQDELAALITVTQAAGAVKEAEMSTQTLQALLPTLQAMKVSGQTHAVVDTLIDAIERRDVDAYGVAYLQVKHLGERQALVSRQQVLLDRMRSGSPELARELTDTVDEPAWEQRLASFQAAWRWVQADARLKALANPDTEVEVREQLASARKTQRDTLGQLAAVRAWRSTMDRMTPGEQAALVRWQNAVRRIGKGTGKHAGTWRKVAQEALNEARSAIPAWIMPVYLVAESFAVSPGMFDVVIVDEASQAGPEALFLTYIAKKIVIVGDDRQIEPEGVGIQLAQVGALVRQYLYDFPAPEVVADVKSSLFGFGSYAYPARVSLREHFRCMPEIIKFSSDLCYADEPLIALRQYGAERLQPLVARYVENGYTTSSRDKVNPVEVRAIVDQIKACIANPSYAGKTFGVISLLGDSQAEEIGKVLRAEVSEAELDKRRLVCGNAYSFQGDERDVIFLSMVATPGGGIQKVGRDSAIFEPRYNVAVSRARDQLWLFHSLELSDLAQDDLRASLIRYVRNPELPGWQPLRSPEIETLRELAARPGRGNARPPSPFDSWFEVDVYLDIISRGYRVIPQYELGGYRIDLVVEGLRGRLAVECDGDYWHGPEKYLDDLARQQTLERAGMEFWRVRGSTYARDPEGALSDLWTTFEGLKVFPEGDPRNFEPVAASESTTGPEALPLEVTHEARQQAADAAQDEAPGVEELALPDTDKDVWPVLSPYSQWVRRELPDPRTLSSLDAVSEGLLDIIAAEGPMTARQAYQTYCDAAGVRLGQATKSLLNRAMSKAIKAGQLVRADEWGTVGLLDKIVRTPDTPPVRLRQLGERKLTDIPPSEVRELMDTLRREAPELASDTEMLYRRVLTAYGAQRLTQSARIVLDRAYELQTEQPALF